MSDPKTISPYFCLPLLEESVADDTHAPAAFQLPQSFPAELLDDDQLAELPARQQPDLIGAGWVSDLHIHAPDRCADGARPRVDAYMVEAGYRRGLG